jgi:hypothetical protein
VWTRFVQALIRRGPSVRLAEVGAGVGTTAIRILETLGDSSIEQISYTLVDLNPDNLEAAQSRLRNWCREQGAQLKGGNVFCYAGLEVSLRFAQADLFDFAAMEGEAGYDTIIAQALLDLLPVARALEALRPLLQKGGVWYLPIHFDGVTAFEPLLDAELDAKITRLYHESMTENIDDEEGGGDGAHTGRRLLSRLRDTGASLVEAGSSDWVVFARDDGYQEREAYFLHHILHFIEQELSDHPDLDGDAFAGWVQQRRQQIEAHELVYVAHQLDVLAVQE